MSLESNEKLIQIQLDGIQYSVDRPRMTSADLRRLPQTSVDWDIDLFEIMLGEPNKKIEDRDVLTLYDGQEFRSGK